MHFNDRLCYLLSFLEMHMPHGSIMIETQLTHFHVKRIVFPLSVRYSVIVFYFKMIDFNLFILFINIVAVNAFKASSALSSDSGIA